jgi:NRPS condensation-like uncharacterized protein
MPVSFPAVSQDVMGYLGRHFTDQQGHYVLALQGRIQEARWAQAVRLVMDAEPVLGCRLATDRAWPEWQRRSDLDSIPVCQTVATEDVESELMRFLACPNDPCKDPMVQARIFRGTQDTICLKVNHAAADGMGIKEVLYKTVAIYGELQDPNYRPLPNTHGSRSFSQILRFLPPTEVANCLRKPGGMPPSRCGFPSSHRDTTEERRFLRRQIAAERFDLLKEYGRARGARFNEVLVTAFFRAMFGVAQLSPDATLTIMVSVDLRRHLPGGKTGAVCNFAGGVYPTLRCIANETFDETLVRVRNWMSSARTNGLGLGAALRDELLAKGDFSKMLTNIRLIRERDIHFGYSTPVFSNVGIIDPDRLDLGVPVAAAYVIGPVVYAPGFMLDVTSFRKVLTLTTGFCQSAVRPEDVSRFLDGFIQEIPGSEA